MGKPKTLAVLAILVALAALLLPWPTGGSNSSPAPAPATPARATAAIQPSHPPANVAPPALPPAPANAGQPDAAAANLAALDKANADIANYLQNDDIEDMVKNYAKPGTEEGMRRTLRELEAEGDGLVRMHQIAHAFATLAGQTPKMLPARQSAEFLDFTIYGPHPPVPVDKIPPNLTIQDITRIPVLYDNVGGHWYLDMQSLATLYAATHNVPYGK